MLHIKEKKCLDEDQVVFAPLYEFLFVVWHNVRIHSNIGQQRI